MKQMRFYWEALIVAFSTAVGVIGVGYLLGDHQFPSDTVVGFFIALAVFAAGVEHLSEKVDKITKAIESVEASVQNQADVE